MIHMIPWNYTYYGTNHILNKPYVKVLQKQKPKAIPSHQCDGFQISGDEGRILLVMNIKHNGCTKGTMKGATEVWRVGFWHSLK